MSDSELDDVQTNNWFDSEAELPEICSINFTPQPGVGLNMGQFFFLPQNTIGRPKKIGWQYDRFSLQ